MAPAMSLRATEAASTLAVMSDAPAHLADDGVEFEDGVAGVGAGLGLLGRARGDLVDRLGDLRGGVARLGRGAADFTEVRATESAAVLTSLTVG
jgi:hypothetical protein